MPSSQSAPPEAGLRCPAPIEGPDDGLKPSTANCEPALGRSHTTKQKRLKQLFFKVTPSMASAATPATVSRTMPSTRCWQQRSERGEKQWVAGRRLRSRAAAAAAGAQRSRSPDAAAAATAAAAAPAADPSTVNNNKSPVGVSAVDGDSLEASGSSSSLSR